MAPQISARISEFIEALPLEAGLRVLEIGCGPGVAARAVAKRIGDGFVLAIRSFGEGSPIGAGGIVQ
nr:hypothetical protein [Mesorhizobium sp. NFR06]